MEFGARMEAFPEKAEKDCRRSRAIEASVVKTQTNLDRIRHSSSSLHASGKSREKGKP
jgi:hypothetical protein